MSIDPLLSKLKMNEFTDLYNNYINDVFRYSMFKLRNKENAEDVTSETFLRAMNKDLLEIKNKKFWLITIARNVIFEKFRQEKKSFNDNEIVDVIPDITSDVEKSALTEEMVEIIKSELDNLDEDTREVLILRIWEELQFKEIAELLKENESTVKLRYYRGLEKLKLNLSRKDANKYITVPILIAGVGLIASHSAFTMSPSLVSSIASSLGIGGNLIITENSMNIFQSIAAAFTAKTKVVAVAAAAVTVTVAGAGTAIILNRTPEPVTLQEQISNSKIPIGIKNLTEEPVVKITDNRYFNIYYPDTRVLATPDTSMSGDFSCISFNLKDDKNSVLYIGSSVGAQESCGYTGWGTSIDLGREKFDILGKSVESSKKQIKSNEYIYDFRIDNVPSNLNLSKYKIGMRFFIASKNSNSEVYLPVFRKIISTFEWVTTNSNNVDSTNWPIYSLTNSDGSQISLKYPSNWNVRSYNNDKTYAFVSPDGSALGYDFQVYSGIQDCKDTKAVEINGVYVKFKRYYDTSIDGVNWFACEFDSDSNKYIIDNSNLISIYVKSDEALKYIDEMLKSWHEVGSGDLLTYTGRLYNFGFQYPKSLGVASGYTTRFTYGVPLAEADQNLNGGCWTEAVTFSKEPELRFAISTGHCEGGTGGDANDKRIPVITKDGKKWTIIVSPLDDLSYPGKYSITLMGYTDGLGAINSIIMHIIPTDQVDKYTNIFKEITESFSGDISKRSIDAVDKIIMP